MIRALLVNRVARGRDKQSRIAGGDAGGERVMIKRMICAAIALCVASGANASTLRLKNYLAPEDEKQRILNAIYLDGLKDGLIAFNVALPRTGAAPLFCLPPTLVFTPEQADEIVMREVKSHPSYPDDMIVSIVLLAGLRKTFPCGEQSK
jgi:Ssp1 endopeptidase immunity protein Rap1a